MNPRTEKHIMPILTLLGMGRLPLAPGTWGSLLAMLFFFIPTLIKPYICAVFIIYFWVISVPLINEIEEEYGDDPSFIVIDEAIGIWIMLMAPLTYDSMMWAAMGFVYFRVFDILKPYPINLLNKKKGGHFVILDDVLSAVFAVIALYLTYWLK